MIFIILNIILSVGTWEVETLGYVKNVTLRSTDDNRVMFDTVTFTDNKVCTVLNRAESKQYTFNTELEAMNKWNTQYLPAQQKRYEERLHITTDECHAFFRNTNVFIPIVIILGILGTGIDILMCSKLGCSVYRICKRNHRRDARIEAHEREIPLNEVRIIPEPVVERHQGIQEKKEKPVALDKYAAELIAEARIMRGDVCPITQESLSKIGLLVPPCGHILSEASQQGNYTLGPKTCCICRKEVVYTRVEAKVSIVKEEASRGNTNPTNSTDSAVELLEK